MGRIAKGYTNHEIKAMGKFFAGKKYVGHAQKADPAKVTAQVAPLIGLPAEITHKAVARQGYGAQPLTPEVVAAQQKIADTFADLKLIPRRLSIKDVVWTPPARVAQH